MALAESPVHAALYWVGRTQEALAEYKWVAERADLVADQDASSLHILGWSLLCLGDYNRAAAYLSKAVALGYDELSALFDLGLNSLAAGQTAEAQETFAEAIRIIDRDMSDRQHGAAERALAHRGSTAVSLFDLQCSVAGGRFSASQQVDGIVAQLMQRLEALTLPAD
jgi:tetratricopeptide (TPR) repeat protein